MTLPPSTASHWRTVEKSASDDADEAYRELQAHGVTFSRPPTPVGPFVGVVLDDACGNLIQLVSPA